MITYTHIVKVNFSRTDYITIPQEEEERAEAARFAREQEEARKQEEERKRKHEER